MKVGWIVPWLHGVSGNRTVLCIARDMARQGNEVHVFSHTVRRASLGDVEAGLEGARLSYVRASDTDFSNARSVLRWQLLNAGDRALSRLIAREHDTSQFDALVLVSNEGRSILRHLRRTLAQPQPLVGCSVMEIAEHSILLRRERGHRFARVLASPMLPAIHWAWGNALNECDLLCANSQWTSEIFEYLYGRRCEHLLIGIPDELFLNPTRLEPDHSGPPYVAVPTISIGQTERRILDAVRRSDIRLVSFGPKAVGCGTHLGFLSPSRVREVLAGAAATLFLFDYEALGLIPFESIAVGTPVVTLPKQGVYRQWAGHPSVRFAEDPGDLAEACSLLLRTPPTQKERTEAAQSIAGYRSSRAAEAFVRFLQTVEGRTTRRARFPAS